MLNNKKGNILTENIIFIVLNLVFITILLVFLFSRVGAAPLLEEKYSKQIAMIVDAAEPGMIIDLQMKEAIETAQKQNFPRDQIVTISGNIVNVRLSEDSEGYSYSFFNNVKVNPNLLENKQGYYFLIE